MVGDPVQVIVPERSPLPCHVAQDTCRGIRLPQGRLQGLLGGRKDLDLGDQRLGHGPSMQRGTDKKAALFARHEKLQLPSACGRDPNSSFS